MSPLLGDQPCPIDLFLFTAGGNLFKTKFLGLSENWLWTNLIGCKTPLRIKNVYIYIFKDLPVGRCDPSKVTSLVAQTVKNPPAMRETWVQSLSQENPLEEEMATHSSILAWEIPWTEEPGRLWSRGLQKVRHNLTIKQQQPFYIYK